MIVMKFGGTSVESAAAIERVAAIVKARLERAPVVVVSPFILVLIIFISGTPTPVVIIFFTSEILILIACLNRLRSNYHRVTAIFL